MRVGMFMTYHVQDVGDIIKFLEMVHDSELLDNEYIQKQQGVRGGEMIPRLIETLKEKIDICHGLEYIVVGHNKINITDVTMETIYNIRETYKKVLSRKK